jgi:hypothetical protein
VRLLTFYANGEYTQDKTFIGVFRYIFLVNHRGAPVWGSEFTTKAATIQAEVRAQFFLYLILGPVVARARVLIYEVLGRSAKAIVRGGVRCASQVLDCGAKAESCGAEEVLYRGAKAYFRNGAQKTRSLCPGRCPRRPLLFFLGT